MEILRVLSGPILGSVIGFGTNYLAIKMLFRPYKPIRIGRKILPFTPGIIPKRKSEIAKAIGQAVGNELFTKEDIQRMLLSEEMEKSISDKIIYGLYNNDKNVRENLLSIVTQEKYDKGKLYLEQVICDKIKNAILSMDLGTIIANEEGDYVQGQVKNPLVKMFLNDSLITSFSFQIANKIETYVKNSGEKLILSKIDKEIENVENQSIQSILNKFNIDESKLREMIEIIYKKMISEGIEKILENFDIAKVVEEKINEMSIEELEKMILKIMKKELSAIVNLGGILGFLIGLLNILVVL